MSDSKYAPRRAQPGERFVFNHNVLGETRAVKLTADDEGLVRPRNALEDEVADLLFLPVARIAEKPTPKTKRPTKLAAASLATSEPPVPASDADDLIVPADPAPTTTKEG